MAKRKVQGGKKIDTWSIEIEERPFEVAVYMTKVTTRPYYDTMPPLGSTLFVAVNEEFDIRHENLDINALQKMVEKTLRERVVVTWERKLLVIVKGDHARKDERGWYDPEALGEPWGPDRKPSRGAWVPERSLFSGHNSSLVTERDVKIRIEAVEIATVAGQKKWRHTAIAGYMTNKLQDGWPSVGDILSDGRYGSQKVPEAVAGMVPDTVENRAALLAIVEAMEALVVKLEGLLTQDNLQTSLVRVLAASSVLSLSATLDPV